LREGGKLNSSFLHSSLLNSTVKELQKLAYICDSYRKKDSGAFLLTHDVLLHLLQI